MLEGENNCQFSCLDYVGEKLEYTSEWFTSNIWLGIECSVNLRENRIFINQIYYQQWNLCTCYGGHFPVINLIIQCSYAMVNIF